MEEAIKWLRTADSSNTTAYLLFAAATALIASLVFIRRLRSFPVLAMQISVLVVVYICPYVYTYFSSLQRLGDADVSEPLIAVPFDTLARAALFVTVPVCFVVCLVSAFFAFKRRAAREHESVTRRRGVIGFRFVAWFLVAVLAVAWLVVAVKDISSENTMVSIAFRLLMCNVYGLISAGLFAFVFYVLRLLGVIGAPEGVRDRMDTVEA